MSMSTLWVGLSFKRAVIYNKDMILWDGLKTSDACKLWHWCCVVRGILCQDLHTLPAFDGTPAWPEAHLHYQSHRMSWFKDHLNPSSIGLWVIFGRQLEEEPKLCAQPHETVKKAEVKDLSLPTRTFFWYKVPVLLLEKSVWKKIDCAGSILLASQVCICHALGEQVHTHVSCCLVYCCFKFHDWLNIPS